MKEDREKSADFSEGIKRFQQAAEKLARPPQGRDILRIVSECEGYEVTPLEQEICGAADRLSALIRANPEQLSVSALKSILGGVILCEPAVDEYRARYLGAAGDYADIQSPVAFGIKELLESLQETLKSLEAKGHFPLSEIEHPLLFKEVKLYKVELFSQELYKFLLSPEMGTNEKEPFATFVREEGEAVLAKVAGLPKQPKDRFSWVLREIKAGVCFTEADITTQVVQGLLPFLDDPNSGIRQEVRWTLEGLGFRAFPSIGEAYLAAQDEKRRLLFTALDTLARNCWSSEQEGVIFLFLRKHSPDPDPIIESTRRDLIRKLEPSAFFLSRVKPSPKQVGKEANTTPALKQVLVEGETQGFYRQAYWNIFDDGTFNRYDSTILQLIKPASVAGKQIHLCFRKAPPPEHVLRRKGERVSFETLLEHLQGHFAFVIWEDVKLRE
jgi:hypothetical protein